MDSIIKLAQENKNILHMALFAGAGYYLYMNKDKLFTQTKQAIVRNDLRTNVVEQIY